MLYLQMAITGISMGMLYALMAMGLTLIVKAVGVLNFAHGQLFMLGAYLTYWLTHQLGLPLWGVIICGVIVFAICGAAYMFSVYWPLRNSPWKVTVTISTLGASIALKELVQIVWGTIPLTMKPIVNGVIHIGTVYLNYQYLFIIAIGGGLMALVYILFEKTFLGKVMQATAQDRYCAELIGIPTIVSIMATYMISLTLSGTGGWLAGPLFLVSSSLGSLAQKAFAGMVLGGFGNVKGAIVGCLLIGMIESFGLIITDAYKDAIVFAVLIIVLVVRPTGIFGEKISEKA
ncbi:MAG: branched-chain amino acid ABC transporter permease [Erysipelotrichales bacterium]|nr:branched-chain amino acid ABC transporter permease [Erysipelotrichales bacterium]MBQ2478422.1 branched-chain amino acid ABC transporter permease [Erysipelotrichales bacterium]MBQ4375619.1 branched-chain amino acid ABC transporter permease [Erysipelotrichales bacterium]MBQ5541536.1 branched-chain amino acid ABC transporter permease [Erysipelotrichales bacterium]